MESYIRRLGFSLVELLVVIGIIALVVGIAMPGIVNGATMWHPGSPGWSYCDTSGLKKYQATITRNDGRGNTRSFTDYCDARGVLEAQRIFEGRYPNNRVSGVREVR